MPPRHGFERRIERLDLSLFDPIFGQSLDGDKLSWLALQRAIRSAKDQYVYLEIGSYLGGSIQQHLIDPRCRRIYSIDKRTPVAADDRGENPRYSDNTTEMMRRNRRGVDAGGAEKVVCFDADARDVDRSRIDPPPDLCFIDGEHTASAVRDDFEFCRSVCARDAIIMFHDIDVIQPAVDEVVRRLEREGVAFRARRLGGVTFAIALGEEPVLQDHLVRALEGRVRRFARRHRLKQSLGRFLPAPILQAARRFAKRWRG